MRITSFPTCNALFIVWWEWNWEESAHCVHMQKCVYVKKRCYLAQDLLGEKKSQKINGSTKKMWGNRKIPHICITKLFPFCQFHQKSFRHSLKNTCLCLLSQKCISFSALFYVFLHCWYKLLPILFKIKSIEIIWFWVWFNKIWNWNKKNTKKFFTLLLWFIYIRKLNRLKVFFGKQEIFEKMNSLLPSILCKSEFD